MKLVAPMTPMAQLSAAPITPSGPAPKKHSSVILIKSDSWNCVFFDFNSLNVNPSRNTQLTNKTKPLPTKPAPALYAPNWYTFKHLHTAAAFLEPTQLERRPQLPIPRLPTELMEEILTYLEPCTPPKRLFRITLWLLGPSSSSTRKTIPLIPEASMDSASAKNQTDLLDWWLSNKIHHRPDIGELYTEKSIMEACKRGHVKVLEWWLESGLELKYKDYMGCDQVMALAAANGHVDVLKFWIRNSKILDFNLTHIEMDLASANGHVDVLDWFLGESGIVDLNWSMDAMDKASENGHINVLEWWVGSGLELKYSADAIDKASSNGQVDCLNWWVTSGLKLCWTERAFLNAVDNGKLQTLKWWKSSGLEMKVSRKWSTDGLYTLNQAGYHNVVVWLMEHGFYQDIL